MVAAPWVGDRSSALHAASMLILEFGIGRNFLVAADKLAPVTQRRRLNAGEVMPTSKVIETAPVPKSPKALFDEVYV